MFNENDKTKALGMCPCCLHDMESKENFVNKKILNDDEFWEKEFAWLFYESGVQDMREEKSLICVYKF